MVYGTIEHPVRDHSYHPVQENLDHQQIARFICGIQESRQYVMGEFGHILSNDTQTVVGYVGDDHVDFVDSSERLLQAHQNSLINIFFECLIEN